MQTLQNVCLFFQDQDLEMKWLNTLIGILRLSFLDISNRMGRRIQFFIYELGMDTIIHHHVTDFGEIASYGVMSTPTLIVDGKLVSFSKVWKKNEVIDILKKNREVIQ